LVIRGVKEMLSVRGSVTTRQALVIVFVTSALLVGIPFIGMESRSVSIAQMNPTTENSPPTIDVPFFFVPHSHMLLTFTVIATDPDPADELQFTWDWGDDSALEVTSTDSADHAYSEVGSYVLTVYADDQTGLPGHNVSDWNLVEVDRMSTDSAPRITQFVKDIANVFTGQHITFTGTATDIDGDLCSMRFEFGDGTDATLVQPVANATVSVTHVYTAGGPKTAHLYAFDGVLTDQTSMSFVVGTTFTMSLATGWNLVSVPRVGYGYKASTLGLTTGDIVSTWNSTTKTYKSYITGVPANDFDILPGIGYWINVPYGNRTLTLQGSIPTTTQHTDIQVPVGGGWAMIGFSSLKTTMKAADIPGMYNFANNITTVAKYNPATKSYTSWLSFVPTINNFALAPGQAYWILASGSGTLTYDP
jgi:hypothetical protein